MAIDNVGKLRSPSVNEPIADSLFISTASTTAEQGFFQWDSSVIFGNPQGFGTTFDKRQLDNVNGFSINDIFPHVDFYEQDLYPAIKKPITAGKVGAFHSSGSTEFSVSIHPFNKGSANFIIGDPT